MNNLSADLILRWRNRTQYKLTKNKRGNLGGAKMIIFNLSEEDMAYAEQLQSYAEMSAIIKAPKSFSSEELLYCQR